MNAKDLDTLYEQEKTALGEEYLEKIKKGVSRVKAEAWLKKNLAKKRKIYYDMNNTIIKKERQKEWWKKKFKPIITAFEKFRGQFD